MKDINKMKDNIVEVNVSRYCRVCFEEKPGLVCCEKVLVVEGFTYTMEEILKLLSAEEIQPFPSYPSNICSACRELIKTTCSLKIMYEKTSELLQSLLKPPDENIKNNLISNEFDYSVTDLFREEYNYMKAEVEEDSVDIEEGPAEFGEMSFKIDEGTGEFGEENCQDEIKYEIEEKQSITVEDTVVENNEIERTINQTNIKLKKAASSLHQCPVCFLDTNGVIEFKEHMQTHKVIQVPLEYEDSIESGSANGSVNYLLHLPTVQSDNCLDAIELVSDDNLNTKSNTMFAEPKMVSNSETFENLECILGKMKMNGEKRRGNKRKDFCLFCKTYVLNFGRHIMRRHSLENEVRKIISFPPKNSERKKLFTALRRKGNFLNSSAVCKAVRQSSLNRKVLPCTNCMGFFSAKLLWRHRKICIGYTDKHHQAKGQDLLVKNEHVDKELREIVFPRMRPDEITFTAKSDVLICAYGNLYLKSHRGKHFINVTSRKMRELAKLLTEIKRSKPQIKDLFDALRSENFELLVSATKVVAGYDGEKEIYNAISWGLNLGSVIKQCAQLGIVFVLKQKETHSTVLTAQREADLKILIQLIERKWRFEITTHPLNNPNMKKWGGITIVLLASDLKVMNNYLVSIASIAMEKLNKNTEKEAYISLMEAVFCTVLLLNRRRPGELQSLLIDSYKNSEEHLQNDEEFEDFISTSERILMAKFKKVVIRGKRGRGAVLFNPDAQEQIKVLLHHRDTFCDKNNFYLFGKPGTNQPICGYKAINKHAKLSGVKNPKAISATKLRKHLATLTQVSNMTEKDIEQLSSFMEQTVNFKRDSNDIYQTAKLSKLLLLREQGQAVEYKGKNLDEINIDLDAELEEENSDDESSSVLTDSYNTRETEFFPGRSHFLLPKETQEHPTNHAHQYKKVKRVLIAWTENQKEEARKFFADHIRKKQPPKKHECEILKALHSRLFENKDWAKIKVFIQNEYVKKKLTT